jgi:hypothetical protein
MTNNLTPQMIATLVAENKDRKEDITMDEIRSLTTFKNLSHAEAMDLLQTIKAFCKIAFACMAVHQSEAKIISISNPKQSIAA